MEANVDITETALNDLVFHKTLGRGVVIECTEKPSIKVQFENGGKMTFTQKTAFNLFEA